MPRRKHKQPEAPAPKPKQQKVRRHPAVTQITVCNPKGIYAFYEIPVFHVNLPKCLNAKFHARSIACLRASRMTSERDSYIRIYEEGLSDFKKLKDWIVQQPFEEIYEYILNIQNISM